ncbi:hypothetical protein G6F68_015978 [Rhizopus microsporus]|nr:hypothetical protein G6F68_015978 [Rhizopus microsporus]
MLASQAEVVGLHPMTAPPKAPTLKGRVMVVCESRLQHWQPWVDALCAALQAECVRDGACQPPGPGWRAAPVPAAAGRSGRDDAVSFGVVRAGYRDHFAHPVVESGHLRRHPVRQPVRGADAGAADRPVAVPAGTGRAGRRRRTRRIP